MAIWPFNRNKNQTGVPVEVQDYYKASRRERVGVAWLVGIVTLIITVLILTGLYFGGRWVYRKIAGTDNNTTQVDDSDTQDESNSDSSDDASDGTDKNKGNQGTESPAPTQPSTGTQTPAPTTTPTTGDTTDLPRTGPDLDL